MTRKKVKWTKTQRMTKNQLNALCQKHRRRQVFPGRKDTVWYTIEVVRGYWEAPCLFNERPYSDISQRAA